MSGVRAAAHMAFMTTATLTSPALDSRTIADILNKALETQPEASPLDLLDRCDRCGSAAQSTFTFEAADVLLCGHHLRMHLPAIMGQQPKEFWISPTTLWKVKGVNVPKQDHALAGDGLTDS